MVPKQFFFKLLFISSLILLSALPALADSYAEGVLAYNKKDYRKALTLFRESTGSGANQVNAAYYVALCHHQLGQIDQAKTSYIAVIKKYPKSQVARQAFQILQKLDPSIVGGTSYAKQKETASLPEKNQVKYISHPGSGHMILPVHINGVPAQMMFDTGASVTVAKQSYLDSRGIKVKNTRQSGRLRGVGGEVAARVGLAEITIGNMSRSIPLMVEQDQASSSGPSNQLINLPLLGQNYFTDLIYEIDDGRRTITFKKAEKSASKSSGYKANEVPFYREGNHIIVKPKVNGRECEMILDTGAGTVAFADRHLAMCGLNRPTSASSGRSGGVGGQREGFNFYIKTMKLGPIEKENVRCSMLLYSRFDKPLLGQTFLQGLHYTIDPTRNVIIFN